MPPSAVASRQIGSAPVNPGRLGNAPCLALAIPASPCRSLPRRALPCLVIPRRDQPRLAQPCPATPNRASPNQTMTGQARPGPAQPAPSHTRPRLANFVYRSTFCFVRCHEPQSGHKYARDSSRSRRVVRARTSMASSRDCHRTFPVVMQLPRAFVASEPRFARRPPFGCCLVTACFYRSTFTRATAASCARD